MQQSVTRRDGYAPSVTARVAGRELEVSEVRVDRALPDPMARDQLTAAEARFTAVEGDAVSQTVATPWDPGTVWPPVPQQPVSVDMDTGSGPVPLLGGGRVVSASGGTGGREVEIEAADAYESLNRTISWDAVAENMPSLEEANFGRYVSMNTTMITNTILDHCGWYSTPPSPGYTMLRVPAQGSTWPNRGYVDLSNRMDGGGYPYWTTSNWGIAAANLDASYTMAGGGYTLNSRLGLELAAMTQTSSSTLEELMYIDVSVGTGTGLIRLVWHDNNASVRLRMPGGSLTTVATVARQDGMLYASIDRRTNQSVVVTLQSGSNVTTTGAIPVTPAFTQGAMNKARIWGLGRAGGFLVCAPNTLRTLANWTPNAVLYPRTGNRNSLEVRPSIEGENCADLLEQQCQAEAATYWIDETGVLRWWDLARLESGATVATLNSDDDIAESGFEWKHDLSQVRSRVSVKWTDMLQARSWRTSVDFHQGRGETLQGGDVIEDWINVPDDEIWIMPDTSMNRLGDSGGSNDDYNYGLFSHYGGVIADSDSWAQQQGSLLMSVERVTDRAFKTLIQWTGSERVVMRTPSEDASSSLWRRRRDADLPIIRGKLKFTLAEMLTYSSQSGPSTAPEYEIDAGWWIQSEAQAQYLADYAGARVTIAQPVLSSVGLIPLPGLQLGDVVELTDTAVTRLNIRGLVIEDSRSISADMDMEHAVTIRPTHISRNGVTYEMWGDVVRGSTYNQWGTRRNGDTYQQWGTYPLAGEAVL